MRDLIEGLLVIAVGLAAAFAVLFCTFGFWAIGALYVMGFLP